MFVRAKNEVAAASMIDYVQELQMINKTANVMIVGDAGQRGFGS